MTFLEKGLKYAKDGFGSAAAGILAVPVGLHLYFRNVRYYDEQIALVKREFQDEQREVEIARLEEGLRSVRAPGEYISGFYRDLKRAFTQ